MSIDNMQSKTCSKCGDIKPSHSFSKGRNNCKQCVSKTTKEYNRRPEVKAKRREYQKKYKSRPGVKARKRIADKEYRARLEVRDRQRQRRQLPEVARRIRQSQKECHQRNRLLPHRKRQLFIAKQNYKARKRSLPNALTADQWQHALNYFNGCCAVCGRQLNDMFGEFTASADHWIPLSYKGDDNPGTVATNIIPLCNGISGCNTSKNATMPRIWLEREFGKRKAKQIAARIQEYFDSIEESTI